MEKRFQVFVSSTFKDLELERQEVMHALLELDCMPAGMELFPAANETQWSLIKKLIDDCDYYVLIIAGRYGSIGDEGISYTEMEYRYALDTNKPIISFIHRDPGKIAADNTEATELGRQKLAEFRKLAEKRLCKQWSTAQELGSVVSRSLIQLIKSTPAIGWVRATELPDKDAMIELIRLRREVDDLQNELSKARTTAPKGSADLAQGDELHAIIFTYDSTTEHWETTVYQDTCSLSWNQMFSCVAPLMIDEANDNLLKLTLGKLIGDSMKAELMSEAEHHECKLKNFSITQEDFQTVKVQFRALGLITKSMKTRSVKDSATYWTLTPYGDEIMTRLRAIRSNTATLQQIVK